MGLGTTVMMVTTKALIGKDDACVNEAGQLKKIPFEIRYLGTIEGRSSRRGKNYFFTMEVQWCARSGNGKSRAGYSKHSYRKEAPDEERKT
jgi:hypothetical protein